MSTLERGIGHTASYPVEVKVEPALGDRDRLTTAFRLPLYLLEVLGQALAFAVERWTGLPTLRWAPVMHHNLSYLRHPFLAQHLALAARSRPHEVLEVANACLRSPGSNLTLVERAMTEWTQDKACAWTRTLYGLLLRVTADPGDAGEPAQHDGGPNQVA